MPRFPFGTMEEASSAIHDEMARGSQELVRIRNVLELLALLLIAEREGSMRSKERDRYNMLLDRVLEGK